jgi:hypothetical protein
MDRAQQEWAQACAALIVESELTDWKLARRKTAASAGLGSQVNEPSDQQIIDAIREYHALFQPEEHAAQLHAQREEALSWMEYFSPFQSRLTGAVAEGWAHAGSEIRIECVVPDEKLFEIKLVNDQVEFRVETKTNGADSLLILDADWPLRVLILSDATRGRARWNPQSPRLTEMQVRALLVE